MWPLMYSGCLHHKSQWNKHDYMYVYIVSGPNQTIYIYIFIFFIMYSTCISNILPCIPSFSNFCLGVSWKPEVKFFKIVNKIKYKIYFIKNVYIKIHKTLTFVKNNHRSAKNKKIQLSIRTRKSLCCLLKASKGVAVIVKRIQKEFILQVISWRLKTDVLCLLIVSLWAVSNIADKLVLVPFWNPVIHQIWNVHTQEVMSLPPQSASPCLSKEERKDHLSQDQTCRHGDMEFP